MIKRTLIITFACLVFALPTAHALVLGSFEFTNASKPTEADTKLGTYIGYLDFATGTFTTVFEDIILEESSVGTTFFATNTNDPDFAAVSQLMTNGLNDLLFVGEVFAGNNSAVGIKENLPARFGLSPFLQNGIDFHGLPIEAFQLDVLSLDFPQTGGFHFEGRFTVQGSENVNIPEPSTLGLFGIGFVMIFFKKKLSSRFD